MGVGVNTLWLAEAWKGRTDHTVGGPFARARCHGSGAAALGDLFELPTLLWGVIVERAVGGRCKTGEKVRD